MTERDGMKAGWSLCSQTRFRVASDRFHAGLTKLHVGPVCLHRTNSSPQQR